MSELYQVIGKNTFLNLLGQALPLLAGLVALPFIVRGLGTDRFGLFSLVLVALSFFSVFDVGLGRAMTKFIADAIGRDQKEQIASFFWTVIIIQSFFAFL